MILPSGEMTPDWIRVASEGALDCALAGAEGLDVGGRIECFLFAKLEAGRGIAAISFTTRAASLISTYNFRVSIVDRWR